MSIPQFNPRIRKNKKTGLFLFEIRDNEGKTIEHQSGFKTKREAENAALEIQQKLRQGYTLDRHTSLYDWYQTWYDLKIRPKKKLSDVTKQNYKTYGETLKRLFGTKLLVNIKATEYQRIMNIYGESVGYDYLSRINSVIRKTIKLAQADKVIVDDFTNNVELFAGKESQKNDEKYLHSEKDFSSFLAYLEQHLNYETSIIEYVLLLLGKTGMRYGELIALTWNDINFKEHYIYTNRRYNTTSWEWTTAKNETSVRYIPIDEQTIFIFKILKEEQERFNALLGVVNKDNFIFFHYGLERGIPSIAATNKALKRILNKLEIKPIISTKGLRHTYGSYLLHKEIDMGVVAKILGHKDIQMLIKVYGHTMTERIDKEFKEVEKIMREINLITKL